MNTVLCDTCPINYILDNNQICVPFCGDGFILPNEECDDNNTNSGDGCSSLCIVESYFVCN
jgi:cysteine-rich repeat protein